MINFTNVPENEKLLTMMRIRSVNSIRDKNEEKRKKLIDILLSNDCRIKAKLQCKIKGIEQDMTKFVDVMADASGYDGDEYSSIYITLESKFDESDLLFPDMIANINYIVYSVTTIDPETGKDFMKYKYGEYYRYDYKGDKKPINIRNPIYIGTAAELESTLQLGD